MASVPAARVSNLPRVFSFHASVVAGSDRVRVGRAWRQCPRLPQALRIFPDSFWARLRRAPDVWHAGAVGNGSCCSIRKEKNRRMWPGASPPISRQEPRPSSGFFFATPKTAIFPAPFSGSPRATSATAALYRVRNSSRANDSVKRSTRSEES